MMASNEPIRGRISCRAISRNRRLSRLRATAVCAYFGTMNPTRGCPRGEAIHRSSRLSVRMRFPSRVTRSNSTLRVSRRGRENRRRSGACVLRRKPNGQPLPTLLPTTAQYLTPPPCRHPLHESVRANAPLISRTIRWLAHVPAPMRFPVTRKNRTSNLSSTRARVNANTFATHHAKSPHVPNSTVDFHRIDFSTRRI